MSEGDASSARNDLVRYLRELWPILLGLAFARANVVVGTYDSYQSTDSGVFGDGVVVAVCAIMAAIVWLIAKRNLKFSGKFVVVVFEVCATAQAAGTFAIGMGLSVGLLTEVSRFVLCTVVCFACSASMFYWVRCIKGSGPTVACLVVMGAFLLSEVVCFLCALMPLPWNYFTASVLGVVQLVLSTVARKKEDPSKLDKRLNRKQYLGTMRKDSSKVRITIASGVGLGFIGVVLGLLRGFPNGSAVAFTAVSRTGYFLLCIAAYAVVIYRGFKPQRRRASVESWIAIEAMAFCSLMLYAAFPDDLQWGAMVVTPLNSMMVAYGLYLSLAFMESGWRDPYYYCIGGYLVFFFPRAATRMLQMVTFGITGNVQLMIAFIALLIAVSAQVMTLMILQAYKFDLSNAPEGKSIALQGLMGLETSPENLFDVRFAAMRENAQELGKRYSLTEREIDVVALYALGFTQKRVGEQLHISTATVHEYVKRIYTKTDLHSRQEIIDYLKDYAS